MSATSFSDFQPYSAQSEPELRRDLAAVYRLLAMFGMDDTIFTHVSLRLPGGTPRFLINPYGLLFDEITASNLVVVDMQGQLLAPSPYKVNPAGFSIHGAIHMAGTNAHCVIHTHSLAGMTVSALEDGLQSINQMSMIFHERVARYSYDTIHFPDAEQRRLVETLGDRKAMLMENHGLLTCGETIQQAFYYMYYLEQACRVQVAAMSTGRPVRTPSPAACESAARLFEERNTVMASLMWEALLRRLDRECPAYRD